MKKIILFIASSLDQYIAECNEGMEWLTEFPEKVSCGYKSLLDSVDTVIMGGRTYREFLDMNVRWLYSGKATYVVSHHIWDEEGNINFITENIIEAILELRNKEGKDILLAGGGKLISMLLEANLIDEMQICYVPKILGKGISLFPEQQTESSWELIECKAQKSGILMVKYRKNI